MTYDIDDLRDNVRALCGNLGPIEMPDGPLDRLLGNGLRRLNKDYPRLVTASIAAAGATYFYQLTSTVAGWVNRQSNIITIVNPAPLTTGHDTVTPMDFQAWGVVELAGGIEWLRIDGGISPGRTAFLRFSGGWAVDELDDATATTITDEVQNALEFVSAAFVCDALGTKSSGHLEDDIPADLINWSTKQQQYLAMAKEFMGNYDAELGLTAGKNKAILVRADYKADPLRVPPLTHVRGNTTLR